MSQHNIGKKVYRLNFGFRSLIDWQQGKKFKRDMNTGGGFTQGTSGLTKVRNIPPRPPLSQATSSPVPGGRTSTGIYWDVRNFSTPPLSGRGVDTPEEAEDRNGLTPAQYNRRVILENLNKYNQQWMYLAAEKMKRNMFAMQKSSEISEEEYRSIDSMMADNPALGALGGIKHVTDDITRYGSEVLDSIRNKASQWNKITGSQHTPDLRTHAEKLAGGALAEGDEFWTKAGRNKDADHEFRMMFKGLTTKGGPSWMASFTQNLVKGGKKPIQETAKIIEDLLRQELEQYSAGAALDETTTTINVRKESEGGGATTGEKAASSARSKGWKPVGTPHQASSPAGVGGARPEMVDGKLEWIERQEGAGTSQPIDLLFHETQKIKEGSEFKRMDLTKSFYIDPKTMKTTGHHGTTTGTKYESVFETPEAAEKSVEATIKKVQIPKYNAMMKLILASVGTKGKEVVGVTKTGRMKTTGIDMQRARDEIKTLGKTWAAFEKYQKGLKDPAKIKHATAQFRLWANKNISKLDVGVQRILQNLLREHNSKELRNILGWVMHHMGNMLPGKGENYANVMSININNNHATLVMVYDIDKNGFYTGVKVNVFDDMTPVQWLFDDKGLGLITEGTIGEQITLGNYGMAAEALRGQATIGVWGRMALMDAPDPVIGIGKIIDAQYTDVMDKVTTEFFKKFGTDIWDKVKTNVHDSAVRFSYNARKPSQMYSLMKWWEYAVGELMINPADTSTAGSLPTTGAGEMAGPHPRRQAEVLFPHPESPVADTGSFKTKGMRDPFWFLWAAPYMTGGLPQIGGATQITGESTL